MPVIIHIDEIVVSQIESTVNRKPKSARISIYVLFWNSAPRSFFRSLSRSQKVNKLKFGAKKGALYGQKKSDSNPTSNMDAMTVLSISWNTAKLVSKNFKHGHEIHEFMIFKVFLTGFLNIFQIKINTVRIRERR